LAQVCLEGQFCFFLFDSHSYEMVAPRIGSEPGENATYYQG